MTGLVLSFIIRGLSA